MLFGGAQLVNVHHCCEAAPTKSSGARKGARVDKSDPRPSMLGVAEGLVPGILLLLLPKCPVCLAAYLALGMGIGVSLATATYLRMVLVTLCVSALSYFVLNCVRQILARLESRQ